MSCFGNHALTVKHRVHLRSSDDFVELARERAGKSDGVIAATIEAGTVAGCERGNFIKEEQLGPTGAGVFAIAAHWFA